MLDTREYTQMISRSMLTCIAVGHAQHMYLIWVYIYIGETHAQGVHGISCVPIATCIYCFNSPFSMSLSRSPVHNSFTDIMPCNVRLHSYKHASITVLIVHVRLGLATLAIGFWHAELQFTSSKLHGFNAAIYGCCLCVDV